MRKIFIFLFSIATIALLGLSLPKNKPEYAVYYPAEMNGPSSEKETAKEAQNVVNQPVTVEEETKITEKGISRSLSDQEYAGLLDKTGIKISKTGEDGTSEDETRCKALIYRSLQIVPQDKSKNLKEVILMFENGVRRGYGSKSRIKIRCVNMKNPELISIFLHETGHVIDLGAFNGTEKANVSEFKDGDLDIFQDDKSLEFYRISWINSSNKKENAKDIDFVSGYGKTDPFEDFAEAFNYYIAHGPAFRKLAQKNPVLNLKYDFIKNNVFNGKEFMVGKREFAQIKPLTRDYDTTIISYNWKAVLRDRL